MNVKYMSVMLMLITRGVFPAGSPIRPIVTPTPKFSTNNSWHESRATFYGQPCIVPNLVYNYNMKPPTLGTDTSVPGTRCVVKPK